MVNLLGERDCAHGRLLCDIDEHGLLAFDRTHAQAGMLGGRKHVGHIGEGHHAVLGATDDGEGEVLGRARVELALHDVFVAEVVDNAAGSILVHGICGLENIVKADAERLHLLGRELHLVLLHVAADNAHLAHAP